MCFAGNLILSTSCEFYYDDITVTLFINIKYGDAIIKSIRAAHCTLDFGDCGP